MKTLSKRKALRFKLPGKQISYMSNGQLGEAVLVDISSGGCSVAETTESVAVDDLVLIILELSDFEKPLQLKATIVRTGEGTFSCSFNELQDDFIKDFPKILAKERRIMLQNTNN